MSHTDNSKLHPDTDRDTTSLSKKNVPPTINIGDQLDAEPEPRIQPASLFDDPENFRIDQSALDELIAEKLLTTVPIKKPNKFDWIRVHPSPKYRMTVAIHENKEEREVYLLLPSVVKVLGESDYDSVTIYLYVNRQKNYFIWPVRTPAEDGKGKKNRWHTSAVEAVEIAMAKWTRVTANMNLGAYEIATTKIEIPEPEWPKESFGEIMKIAFKDYLIDSPNHLVVQKLLGRA